MRFEDTEHSTPSTAEQEKELTERLDRSMLHKLRHNRGKRHWRDPDVPDGYLFDRLHEEVRELREAIATGSGATAIWDEAADVAIFAAMIADRAVRGARP